MRVGGTSVLLLVFLALTSVSCRQPRTDEDLLQEPAAVSGTGTYPSPSGETCSGRRRERPS